MTGYWVDEDPWTECPVMDFLAMAFSLVPCKSHKKGCTLKKDKSKREFRITVTDNKSRGMSNLEKHPFIFGGTPLIRQDDKLGFNISLSIF